MCYIARVPVCVLRRTHITGARTILFCPVLGVFCDNNDATTTQRNDANSQIIITSVPARSFASDTYCTQLAEAANVCGPVAEEIILCSLKVIYIVCYIIARVPVCVCDGRTILFCPVLGVFCDATPPQTPYTCDAVDLFCPVLGVFCDATPPQSAAAATPLTNNSSDNNTYVVLIITLDYNTQQTNIYV